MKKHYVKPMMIGEEFSADEFVSACFYIACESSSTGHSKDNDGTGCRWPNNQEITVIDGEITDSAGVTISVIETNVKINGNYTSDRICYFDRNKRTTTLSGVNNNETITWYTDIGYYIMEHHGTVRLIDENRANHS